jgi:hypothetical protein
MADDVVNQAPSPPADLAVRHIPEKLLNLAAIDLFRIHRKIHSPIFYNLDILPALSPEGLPLAR